MKTQEEIIKIIDREIQIHVKLLTTEIGNVCEIIIDLLTDLKKEIEEENG